MDKGIQIQISFKLFLPTLLRGMCIWNCKFMCDFFFLKEEIKMGIWGALKIEVPAKLQTQMWKEHGTCKELQEGRKVGQVFESYAMEAKLYSRQWIAIKGF